MLKDWSSPLVKNETLFLMCQKIFVNGINSLCSVELSPDLWAQVPVELSRIPYYHSRKCEVQCKEGTVLHLLQPIQLEKDNSQQTSKLPLFTPFSSHKLTLEFFLAICCLMAALWKQMLSSVFPVHCLVWLFTEHSLLLQEDQVSGDNFQGTFLWLDDLYKLFPHLHIVNSIWSQTKSCPQQLGKGFFPVKNGIFQIEDCIA